MNLNLNQNILPKQFSNGRLDIESPSPSAQFALFDRIPISSQCKSFTDAMTGNWNDTPMSLAFFSDQNMQIIQNGIRAGVYNQSGGKYDIGPQDCDNLKMIMRAIYFQHVHTDPAADPFNHEGKNARIKSVVLRIDRRKGTTKELEMGVAYFRRPAVSVK